MFKMLPLYPLAGNLIPCLTRAETGTQNFKVGVGFKVEFEVLPSLFIHSLGT